MGAKYAFAGDGFVVDEAYVAALTMLEEIKVVRDDWDESLCLHIEQTCRPYCSLEKTIEFAAKHQVGTMAQLLKSRGAEGTGTVMDICRVSADPEAGSACPLTSAEYERCFGTLYPGRSDVDSVESILPRNMPRSEARYAVMYREGKPDAMVFAGVSGD